MALYPMMASLTRRENAIRNRKRATEDLARLSNKKKEALEAVEEAKRRLRADQLFTRKLRRFAKSLAAAVAAMPFLCFLVSLVGPWYSQMVAVLFLLMLPVLVIVYGFYVLCRDNRYPEDELARAKRYLGTFPEEERILRAEIARELPPDDPEPEPEPQPEPKPPAPFRIGLPPARAPMVAYKKRSPEPEGPPPDEDISWDFIRQQLA
jgi:hypothetical protein